MHVTEEKDFRYAAPKPQTKEAGIIMLADSVEASSRLLDDPTPKRIETHVQEVIEKIIHEGKFFNQNKLRASSKRSTPTDLKRINPNELTQK